MSAGAESTFTYDAANRLVTRIDVIGGNSFATSYQYDSRDNVAQVTYPSGRVVQYQYDAASRITKVRLIRSRGHVPKGGCDVRHGIEWGPAATPAVL